MAKVENIKQSNLRQTSLGETPRRSARALTNAQKVEELKLGKFAECKPLRLPEKQIRRGWQITWGIVLLLVALVGAYIILMTDPVRVLTWDNDGFGGGRLGSLDLYWWVMIGTLAVAVVCCIAAGLVLLLKKHVPRFLWYSLIAAATVAALCASFHTFTWFEARDCYENYPGIYPEDPSKGSGCPSVVNDLILISLRNLAIYTAGIVAFWFAYRWAQRRLGCGHKGKR